MTWHQDAACKGNSVVIDHPRSPAARDLCDRCPVIAECAAEADRVRPVAGRWAGRVYDLTDGPKLPRLGKVQRRIVAELERSDVVDDAGRAVRTLATLVGHSRNTVGDAVDALVGRGLVVRDHEPNVGTWRIALADEVMT